MVGKGRQESIGWFIKCGICACCMHCWGVWDGGWIVGEYRVRAGWLVGGCLLGTDRWAAGSWD